MPGIRRRRMVQTSALALLSGLTGCSEVVSPESDDASRLGRVEIVNHDTEQHDVALRIVWADRTVHDRSYTLPADDPGVTPTPGTVVEQTWPEQPGDFQVEAHVDGGDWTTVTPAQRDYPDCYSVLVDVDTDGELVLFSSTNAARCTE